MKSEQKALIERTLLSIGIASIAGIGALISYGVYLTIIRNQSVGSFASHLFDPSDGGTFLYPLVGIAIVAIWIRAFLHKGWSE